MNRRILAADCAFAAPKIGYQKPPLTHPRAWSPAAFSCPSPGSRVDMAAPTKLVTPALAEDLRWTLKCLREARAAGDDQEAYYAEKRLNWLIETRLSRKP